MELSFHIRYPELVEIFWMPPNLSLLNMMVNMDKPTGLALLGYVGSDVCGVRSIIDITD